MTEKVLNEFAVRLNKSRTQLTDVCNQVEHMEKEVNCLNVELREAAQLKISEQTK
jgi:hypothetical protein